MSEQKTFAHRLEDVFVVVVCTNEFSLHSLVCWFAGVCVCVCV